MAFQEPPRHEVSRNLGLTSCGPAVDDSVGASRRILRGVEAGTSAHERNSYRYQIRIILIMERTRKSRGSSAAVAAPRPAPGRCGDLAVSSIQARQRGTSRPRGLAGIVAAGVQIRLLDMAPMLYHPAMDQDNDAPRPPPAGWLESLERSEAQLAAGQVVSAAAVRQQLRDSIARMEARLGPEHTTEAGPSPHR